MSIIYKRLHVLKQLRENLGRSTHFIQIVVGPRQVGKTTAVHHLLEEWTSETIYLTADQLTPPTTELIEDGWKKARLLKGEKPLLVIDEIQKIPHWSDAVKRFHDDDKRKKRSLRVILLGSSALSLQQGMIDSLAGRFQLIPCSHWSYEECKNAFRWTLKHYLFFGGYPGAAPLTDDFNVWRDYVQNSLLETVIGRDIPSIRRIDNPALFRQTLTLACQQPAVMISLQKLVGQLQDRGSLNTIAHYLDLLSAAFLVEPLRKWSTHPIRVRNSSPKLIVRNNALVNAVRNIPPIETEKDSVFYGRLIENAIGANLINSGHELYYWNDRDKEVDFIIKMGNRLIALEIKSGRKGDSSSLKIFHSRYPTIEIVRIGGNEADMSIDAYFEKGLR